MLTKEIERFYKLLNINIFKKPFCTFEKINNQDCFVQKQQSLFDKVYSLKRKKKENIWFAVNEFATTDKTTFLRNNFSMNFLIEHREKICVKKFNAVYVDIDFKNPEGKYFDIDTVHEKKKELWQKIKTEMILQPSAIIESRNGFHIYLALDEESRGISCEQWEDIENRFFHYMKENISVYADEKAKLVTQVLRCPGTIHKKDGLDEFEIKVISLHSKHYSINELEKAFPPVKSEQREQEKKEVKPKSKAYTFDNNDLADAIKKLDASYFSYVPKLDIALKWVDAVEFIRQYDIRDFFNLNVEINCVFPSMFRQDNKPSCAIYQNKVENRYYYNDFGDADFQNVDLFQIVQNLASVDFNTSVEFLCDVFQISLIRQKNGLVKDIDSIIASNINVFEKVANSDKKLKFMREISDVYKSIMKMWKERQDKANFNNPLELYLSLGRDKVAEKANIEATKISRILLILEGLNALEKVQGKKINSFLPVNTYLIQELNEDALKSQALSLKQHISNIFQITRSKLEEFQENQS